MNRIWNLLAGPAISTTPGGKPDNVIRIVLTSIGSIVLAAVISNFVGSVYHNYPDVIHWMERVETESAKWMQSLETRKHIPVLACSVQALNKDAAPQDAVSPGETVVVRIGCQYQNLQPNSPLTYRAWIVCPGQLVQHKQHTYPYSEIQYSHYLDYSFIWKSACPASQPYYADGIVVAGHVVAWKETAIPVTER
jgi:hypothetical protein